MMHLSSRRRRQRPRRRHTIKLNSFSSPAALSMRSKTNTKPGQAKPTRRRNSRSQYKVRTYYDAAAGRNLRPHSSVAGYS